MSKMIELLIEVYELTEKVANQKKGVEMRLDNDDVSSVDWEGAFDVMVSEARLMVSRVDEYLQKCSKGRKT
jgi:hypothetical protein